MYVKKNKMVYTTDEQLGSEYGRKARVFIRHDDRDICSEGEEGLLRNKRAVCL